MRRGHRRISWIRVFILLLVLAVVGASLAAAAMYAYAVMFDNPVKKTRTTLSSSSLSADDTLKKRINILLLGVDDGEYEKQNTSVRRSDTMIVASINPEDGTINLLSIPRDTKVEIPGRKGYDKITHAFAYGGPSLAVRTVEEFLHIPVDYYIVMNWQGFIKIIDILGGVDLYVEHDMHYTDPYADLRINLTKGYQHLDGLHAGYYVRFRHDELGDIGRVQRQQRFLKALADQMMQVGTIFKLPALASTLDDYVETDMSLLTMIRLANTVKNFNNGIKAEMLPGSFGTSDGLSFWVPDREQTKQLVEKMFSGSGDRKLSGIQNTN